MPPKPRRPPDDFAIRLATVRELCRSGEAERIRVAARVSLAEMGQTLGTNHSVVWRWEKGERMPKGEQALRYLAILEALRKVIEGDPEEGA